MRNEIIERLKRIEHDHEISIIYACESGSRAWGFPSADSDYDVRFVYVHKREWYLSISDKRDVIELPIEGLLDINGWDLKKALGLLRKSNPALLEWLNSPIIYQKNEVLLAPFIELLNKAFLPESSCHHYLSMANTNRAGYINSDKTKLKKYLYTVRPLLCCQWVIDQSIQPPMLFSQLLDEYLPAGSIREIINELLLIKSDTNESDLVNRNRLLEAYIDAEYERLNALIPKNPDKQPIEIFDETFRTILRISDNHGKSN